MGPIFALMLVATPVCQWTGTNWDPGVVVNAPDGQPLFAGAAKISPNHNVAWVKLKNKETGETVIH